MKLQKKIAMLGVALATTGMFAVSNMSSVSAKEEVFNSHVVLESVNGHEPTLRFLEYAFVYSNQTNPEAIIDFGNRKVTVPERLKEVPLSKYEKSFSFKGEQLVQVRNNAIKKLKGLVGKKGVWKQTEQGWHYVIWYGNGGVAAEGWIQDGGNWYYLGTNGVMVTGWAQVNGKWYYLQPSGAMATGWVKVDGNWYYLDESGAMKTGWFEVGGKWYYAYASGALAVNTTIDGYTVNGNGEWV